MNIARLTAVALIVVFPTACVQMQDNPKQTAGTLLGAGLGALAETQIEGSKGQFAGAAIGALGGETGKPLDRSDKLYAELSAQQALEYNAQGQTAAWRNPDTGHRGSPPPLIPTGPPAEKTAASTKPTSPPTAEPAARRTAPDVKATAPGESSGKPVRAGRQRAEQCRPDPETGQSHQWQRHDCAKSEQGQATGDHTRPVQQSQLVQPLALQLARLQGSKHRGNMNGKKPRLVSHKARLASTSFPSQKLRPGRPNNAR